MNFMGFDIEALSQDDKLIQELYKLFLTNNPFLIIYRILKFDITIWNTRYFIVNRIFSYIYGVVYYLLFIGTLLYLFGLI